MRRTVLTALALTLMLPLTVTAQHWTEEEMEVWDAIRALWEGWNANDLQGSLAHFHPEALGWASGTPLPRDVPSMEKTTRFSMEQPQTETLFWEIQPVGMRIVDNVAIAFYFYRGVELDAEQKRQTNRYRYAEVLTKSAGRWVWIGWYQDDVDEN